MTSTKDAPDTLAQMRDFALDCVTEARAVALQWFRHPIDVMAKDDDSPVTIADRSVEAFLRKAISTRYPDHGILGEEFGRTHLDADYVWSIDPIDGTRSFISGSPLWGSLLALLHRGQPALGIIDIPFTSERWVGECGAQSLYNGKPCCTRSTGTLEDAVLYATSPDLFEGGTASRFDALSRRVGMRRFGGDCYSYGLLASGHIDLVAESGLQPYDYLAICPVVEGAGGVVTDWTGKPLTPASGGNVLAAANADIHRQALALLNA